MREAQAQLSRDAGGHLTDDELLSLIARMVLGGPADTGRAGYQIAVSVCPRCEQTPQQGGGDEVAIDQVAAEMAACDAQVIDLAAAAARASAVGRARAGVDGHVGAGESDAHVRAGGSDAHVGAGGSDAHVGAGGSDAHVGAGRATQSIPPATRRLVMRRDRGRCVVPGCRHVIVDCHHLRRRADGGTHDPDNIVCACSAHHARIHKSLLIIEGSPSAGLRFFHADGTVYGGAPAPQAAQAFSEALSGWSSSASARGRRGRRSTRRAPAWAPYRRPRRS